MSPNSERNQPLLKSRASFFRGPAAILGLLFVLMLLLVAMPAGRAGALPDYVQRDILVALNYETAEGTHLGESVAASGDTIVVGAPGENNAAGAVYVYVRPAGGWTTSTAKVETAKLEPSVLTDNDHFGESVAISGDTIVVGAPGDDGDTGAAYVFVRPEGGWANTDSFAARLAVSTREVNDFFGVSVAISGDTIVVGAPATGNGSKHGAAFVFTRPTTGWSSTAPYAKLSNTSGEFGDDFGASVATHAATVVVGAGLDDIGADEAKQADQGSAYIFLKPGGAWADDDTPDSQLTAYAGKASDLFGISVSIREDGEAVVVGAEDAAAVEAGPNKGAAYVFMKPDGGWAAEATEDALLSVAAGAASDKFGHAVSISGDTIVVGAYLYAIDDDDDEQQGAAFVFVQPNAGPQDPSSPYEPWVDSNTPEATLSAGADGALMDQFGESVATSGGTIAVGVPIDTLDITGALAADIVGPAEQGSAYVFMNGYCSAQSGMWHTPATWVGGNVPSSTADACISTGDVVEMDAVPAVDKLADEPVVPVVRRLLVNPGAALQLANFDLHVNQEVTNNGTLQQIEAQGAFDDAEILQIQQEGAAGTLYWGVNVDSASDLGAITAEITENIDWFSPTSEYNYCTSTGSASPGYSKRCYTISPAAPAASTVTLWAREGELNGIAVEDLAVYHFNGSSYEKLTNISTSFPGATLGWAWAKGDTTSFSSFILGDVALGPTAVTMIAISGSTAVAVPLLLLAGVVLLALLSLGLMVHLRRKRV